MLVNLPTKRRAPSRGMLNKYSVNLGALGLTGDEVKQYFEIASYRNVLDMLLTFEGLVNTYGNVLYNNTMNVLSYGGDRSREILYNSGAATGYAIKVVGDKGGKRGYYSQGFLLQKLFTSARFGTMKTYSQLRNMSSGDRAAIKHKSIGYFDIGDLLRMGRSISYELNRLRLPTPHNFRQILDKIQDGGFNINPIVWVNIGTSGDEPDYFRAAGNINNFIRLADALNQFPQLKITITALRNATRKEIDAANVAAKVEEQTIRREQEELISRQAAEKQAEEKRLKILEEKKAAYEAEFAAAEKIKNDLAAIRKDLEIEAALLAQQKADAKTDAEKQAAYEAEQQALKNLEKLDEIEQDKSKSLDTAIEAGKNLNDEIDLTISELEKQKGGLIDKKSPVLPIILTLAAGYFLT